MRVLSLTCSATGYDERHWNIFDLVHNKKKPLRAIDIKCFIFFKYNLQHEMRQKFGEDKGDTYEHKYLSNIESDDEWITKKRILAYQLMLHGWMYTTLLLLKKELHTKKGREVFFKLQNLEVTLNNRIILPYSLSFNFLL